MVKFTTETGSIYEIDEIGGRVRRLSGNHVPTARQGEDGSWRSYYFILNNPDTVWVGNRVLIIWNEEGQSTLTSKVVEFERW